MAGYLVFAKDAFEQELTLQGRVEADTPEAAAVVAGERFGDAWVAMTLVPETAARWVVSHVAEAT